MEGRFKRATLTQKTFTQNDHNPLANNYLQWRGSTVIHAGGQPHHHHLYLHCLSSRVRR